MLDLSARAVGSGFERGVVWMRRARGPDCGAADDGGYAERVRA